jgi:hypothetical protein
MQTGLFHQNCMCFYKICRPLNGVKCVANYAIAIGVENICDHILGLKGETNEFHKL